MSTTTVSETSGNAAKVHAFDVDADTYGRHDASRASLPFQRLQSRIIGDRLGVDLLTEPIFTGTTGVTVVAS